MKQGINLTLGRKRTDSALRKAFIITGIFFCITVILSFFLIVFRLFLKNTYDTLDSKEQLLNTQLLSMQQKKDKILETKSRLTDIQNITAKRSSVVARIDNISNIVPEGAVQAINGNDIDIQITLESDDLQTLSELIEQRLITLAQDKKKGIKRMEVRSFGLNPKTLKYSTTFGVKFN